MSEGFSIIQIGNNLSKPVTVFIEKISNAIEGYFRPYQIRRVAKADSDAEIIKAQGQIEKDDLVRRSLVRFINEEAKKQNNMELIMEKAIPLLSDSSNPKDMDDDWITNFFDKCRIISDEEMHLLWAKILSSEANNPGTYSKRTVNFLGSLDKSDAELFAKFCSFSWSIADRYCPLIYDTHAAIYNDHDIMFESLTHLDDIGLINFSTISDFQLTKLEQQITVSYFNTTRILNFKNAENNELFVGCALLTNVGSQLAIVCNSEPIDGFFDYVINQLTKEEGLSIILPEPS